MSELIRVSLPGFDAMTDTNPDHFALVSDQNNVLIKEKARGTVSLTNGQTLTVSHGLLYVPFFLAFAYASFGGGTFRWIQCAAGFLEVPAYGGYADITNLYLQNNSGATTTFQYYIFYDQQV